MPDQRGGVAADGPTPRAAPRRTSGPWTRLTRLAVACLVGGLGGLAALAAAAPAGAEPAVPPGWRVVERRQVAPGVEHWRLVDDAGPVVADVASVSPGADVELRAVLSNGRIGPPEPNLERTSEMCRRTDCVVAVNADFFSPETGVPVGGLISGGELVRSPSDVHHQVSVGSDGRLHAATVAWSGRLMPSDLRPLALDGVNVPRDTDRLVMYTPAIGPTTLTNPFGAELAVRVIEPGPPLRLDQTALVELVELRDGIGDAPVPSDGAVLSGHGAAAAALRDLWARVGTGAAGTHALLRLEAAGRPSESVGGTPILLRDGRRWVADDDSTFVRGRHPRTAVGWNPAGETFLVTVDGRQPGYSVGLSLAGTAELMAGLGATDAVNLDGGGSTTFVVGGDVANRPSDRLVRDAGGGTHVAHEGRGQSVVGPVERPVAVALAVVPRAGAAPPRDPLAGSGPSLPIAPGTPRTTLGDPGSDPTGSVPALVGVPARPPADPRVVALATLANTAVVAGTARTAGDARRARRTRRARRAPPRRRIGPAWRSSL